MDCLKQRCSLLWVEFAARSEGRDATGPTDLIGKATSDAGNQALISKYSMDPCTLRLSENRVELWLGEFVSIGAQRLEEIRRLNLADDPYPGPMLRTRFAKEEIGSLMEAPSREPTPWFGGWLWLHHKTPALHEVNHKRSGFELQHEVLPSCRDCPERFANGNFGSG